MTRLLLTLAVVALASAARAAESPATGASQSPASAPPQSEVPTVAAPAAPVSDPHVTLDLSVGVGGGDSTGDGEPLVGWGLHLTVRPVERLVLGASMEGATNWIGSIHGFLTGGVGLAKSLPAGRLVVMALGGIHGLDGAALGGLADHSMKTLGARASWEGSLGRWIFARGGLAASAYFDLERPYDAKVDGHVGGVTILVSVALGLGLGV